VPVAPITCHGASEPYSVHAAADAARRQRERHDLLTEFREWSLHDFDQDGGYLDRPLPLFRGDQRGEVAGWVEKAGLFAAQAYRLQAAVAQVGERHFDGAAALFPDVAESLAQDAEIWEHASELFGQGIVAMFEDAATMSGIPTPWFERPASGRRQGWRTTWWTWRKRRRCGCTTTMPGQGRSWIGTRRRCLRLLQTTTPVPGAGDRADGHADLGQWRAAPPDAGRHRPDRTPGA